MFDVKAVREDFPILSTTVYGNPLVYLDNGATAQKPLAVLEVMDKIHREINGNIHRGVHYLSAQTTAEYEKARQRVADFIGAESLKSVIFTSGATQSINIVASSWAEAFIEEGDSILVSEMEHHSNIVPWQIMCERYGATLKVIPFDNNGDIDLIAYSELLDESTKLVAVTAASNVLGTMPDVKRMGAMAHSVGAKILVDGCQAIVHGEIDVKDLDCDFFAFSGHKLYAPTGIGVLYGKEEILELMPPYMGGGDMVARVTFEKTTYAELPLKFEAGTQNYVGAIALGEAINYLNGLDLVMAHAHERELLSYATESLSKIDSLRIYGNSISKCAIISFEIEGIHSMDLGMILDKQGVAIRTGTHCAEPTINHFGLSSIARVSFAMYNTFEEVDRLCEAIKRAITMLKG